MQTSMMDSHLASSCKSSFISVEVEVLHFVHSTSFVSKNKVVQISVKKEVMYLIVMFVIARVLRNPSSTWTFSF